MGRRFCVERRRLGDGSESTEFRYPPTWNACFCALKAHSVNIGLHSGDRTDCRMIRAAFIFLRKLVLPFDLLLGLLPMINIPPLGAALLLPYPIGPMPDTLFTIRVPIHSNTRNVVGMPK